MIVLGIDPGPTESAFMITDGLPRRWGHLQNDELLQQLDMIPDHYMEAGATSIVCVIERIESYGMAVGREVFETCFWTGRFMERWYIATSDTCVPILMPRRDVKLHLCNSNKATDANIRQAIIDRFGPGKEKAIGKKAAPGPLYGIAGDVWSALAIGLTYHDRYAGEDRKRQHVIQDDSELPF